VIWIQYIWHTRVLTASADVTNIQIPNRGIALAFINNSLLSITRDFQKPNFHVTCIETYEKAHQGNVNDTNILIML